MAVKLNDDQRHQILRWLARKESYAQIRDLIDDERRDQVFHGGVAWPAVSRQLIKDYDARYGGRIAQLAEEDTDLAIGSGLNDRRVIIQSCSDGIDGVDRIIGTLERSFHSLAREGTLLGLPQGRYQDDPDVLEADYAVDGAPHYPVPMAHAPRQPAEADPEDPRWERMKGILDRLPKVYKSRLDYLTLAAKTAGLLQGKPDDGATSEAQLRGEAEELLRQLRADAAAKAGVPR